MVKFIAIILLLICGAVISSFPWLSAIAYMTVSVLQPQYIWFWSFEGFPIFKISAILSIVSLGLMFLKGEVETSIYKYKQNLAIMALFILINISNLLTPFPDYFAGVASEVVIGTFNTIVIMYFVVLGLLNNELALKYATYIFIVITAYYIYWSNYAYLSNNWTQFSNGRLNGPNGSPYNDGNGFAIIFVCGMPFILFGIFYFKQIYIKILMIMLLPLLWHSLLLTSSRGALLSAGIVTIISAFLLKSKKLNIILVLSFIFVVITQGHSVIYRSLDIVDRFQQGQEQEDVTINPRLVSWGIGLQLITKYPILGVGPQRFQVASQHHFPGKSPHVAHNTLIAIAVDMGIPAGLCFLSLFIAARKRFKTIRPSEIANEQNDLLIYARNSTSLGLLGFFVGSMFLDLLIFEIFYFLLLLNLVTYHLYLKQHNGENTLGEKHESQ
jgi:O-antigen ligase